MTKINKAIILSVFLYSILVFSCQSPVQENSWMLNSPNGGINLTIDLVEGKLYYKVVSGGQSVLGDSRLGIVREDTDLSQNLEFIEASQVVVLDDQVNLSAGKQVQIKENGNSQSYTFKNQTGNLITVECKMYNDGLALRYVFPETTHDQVIVQQDLMEFNVPTSSVSWLQPYDKITRYTPAYEWYVENSVSVGEISSTGNGWCFPALFKNNDHWLLLSEAGIDGDYAGSHLDNDKGSSIYRLRWPEKNEAKDLGEQYPTGSLPWQTSWKTIAIGDLNAIVKSDIVKLVSPPSKLGNTSWIKPGRASWSWLSDHDSPQDFSKLKAFIDLSVDMGWEYSLVDANWDRMKGGDIKQLVDYANEKGVGILMWYNSGGPHNDVTEAPRNIMSDPVKRKEEFAKLQEWGVKGVKIDFFQSDKQLIMQLYRDILEDAAQSEILVDFHGCTIPRGWSRTYPNLMSMESVRGAECYTFAEGYAEKAPELNTILPFTRNVLGSMDYTPIIFTDMQYPHLTSFGHEIALAVVFESGLLHFGDAVEGYQALGEKEKTFLKKIPATWDEVKYLSGIPGKDAVLARRKGDNWYVGGINGEGASKKMNVDLSFLQGDYTMLRIVDGKNDQELVSDEIPAETSLNIDLLPYGGFALQLTKK